MSATKQVNKLETTVAGLMKSVPHLPKNAQKWIAENVWWLALIGLIISVIGIIGMIGLMMTALTFLAGTSAAFAVAGVSTFNGFGFLATIISLLFSVLSIALIAMAIKPLKSQLKKGWTLMFAALIVNAVGAVVSTVLDFNIWTFLPSLLMMAVVTVIVAYLLFEIRGYFGNKPVVKATTAKKPTPTVEK